VSPPASDIAVPQSTGDADTAAAPAAPAQVPTPAAAADQARYDMMVGEMAAERQQPELAAEEFLKVLDIAPDPKLAARATSYALAANREDLALTAAHRWQALDPSNLDAREVVIRLALRTGRDADALAQCEAIVKDHPGGIDEGLRHVALVLTQEPDKAAAGLALMDRLVAEYPARPAAWSAKSLLALRLGQFDAAETAGRKALQLDPGSRNAAMLLTGALVKKGDIAGATEIVDGVAAAPGIGKSDLVDIRLGYAKLLLDSGLHDPARSQLEQALVLDPQNSDARLALGLLALDERKLDEAAAQFRALEKVPDKQDESTYFMGRVEETRGNFQQALDDYRKVNGGDQALDAAVRSASMLGRLNRVAEAREAFEGLRRQYPPLATHFYIAEGDMLLDAGQVQQALVLYDTALGENPGDPDLLYSRALAFDRVGMTDRAEADLRLLIAGTPDDARALNALGYMLVERTNRYDEASTLIARALKLTPNDPAVIDSMGWVEFKRGHDRDALSLLQKAYGMFPDPEIAAHLGEVMWTLGNRDGARSLWNTALKSDPDDPVLRATVKRFGQ